MSACDDIEISIVVSGRNDNWNGSFDRVAPFVMARNAEIVSRHTPSFEQIFVEWAPLEDRPLLSHRLAGLGPQVRCFVVPRAIHDGFRPGIAFLQYHARNVGVRRARGRRIVATNADILLTPQIVEAILRLPPRTCLRTPRHDVALGVLDQIGSEAVLQFCQNRRNHVAEHPITRLSGRQVIPWFENAAGDFACMHHDDWLACQGWHERVDASMGVDAELVGQALRTHIEVVGADHPVYHVDHPEDQPGRLHMPPFSKTGYANPPDWGLAPARFEPIAPQVLACPAELAGTFHRVSWPPPIRWPSGFDGRAILHEPDIARGYDAIVFCGLSDRLFGFSLYVDLVHGRPRVWDDGSEYTAHWLRELDWPAWAALEPTPGVLFLALADSPAARALTSRGAVLGRDLLLVEPDTLTTFSPMQRAMSSCPDGWNTAIVYGYGWHGRVMAEWLRSHPQAAPRVAVCDDDPQVQDIAGKRGLEILAPHAMRGAAGGQLILVSPRTETGGAIIRRRLRGAQLRQRHDWIAWPFALPRNTPRRPRRVAPAVVPG